MAQLGFRTIEEMVGRTDRLEPQRAVTHWKAKGLDFSRSSYSPTSDPKSAGSAPSSRTTASTSPSTYDPPRASRNPRSRRARRSSPSCRSRTSTASPARSPATKLPRSTARRPPEDTIRFRFKGSAGESFGAFVTRGMTLSIEGDANDYFGQRPPAANSSFIHPRAPASSRGQHHHRQRRDVWRHGR